MKKLISLMLALLMVLSCACASADTISAKVNIDRDQAKTLASGFGVPDEQLEMVDTVIAVLNALGVNVTLAGSDVQVDVDLNGTNALTVGVSMNDTGVAVASTLFPNYVVTASQETIGQLMEQMTAQMPVGGGEGGFDMTAMVDLFSGYFTRWFEACAAAGQPGEPVPGEYQFDDYTFDTMVPVTVDMPAISAATTSLIDEMLGDEAAMAALEGYLKSAGKELDKDELKAGVEEWIAHFPETVTAEFYCNSDGSETFYLTGESIMAGEDAPTVSYYMLYKDAANMVMGCEIDGEEPIEMAFAKEGDAIGLSFKSNDVYFGFSMNFTDDRFDCDLYFMNDEKPLVSATIAVSEGGEITLSTDATGKNVLAVEDVMADESGEAASGLIGDLTSNGLMALMGALSAVPELSGLLSMLAA